MSDKRNITKEDIYLKARVLAEGIRYDAKDPSKKGRGAIVLDGCELPLVAFPNPYSRLEIAWEGDHAAITDMGEVLGTGTPAKDSSLLSIPLNFSCHNRTMGMACKYCMKAFGNAGVDPIGPEAREVAARSTDGVISAIQNGWRGILLFSQGVLPPSQRHELTGLLEGGMDQLRESLDEDVLSELQIAPNVYPPDDFSEMYKWKDLGLTGTAFDLEVMDPAYWAAICPGKNTTYTHAYWKEAQEAAAEIFGRGRGSISSVVMGIEPMAGFVEGVEERISKGVYTVGYAFHPQQGSAYQGFRQPTADWFVEACEKIVDSYLRYAGTLDVDLLSDTRHGATRMGRSDPNILIGDEMSRRLQEMGKLPPGLPVQGYQNGVPSEKLGKMG